MRVLGQGRATPLRTGMSVLTGMHSRRHLSSCATELVSTAPLGEAGESDPGASWGDLLMGNACTSHYDGGLPATYGDEAQTRHWSTTD